MVQALAHVSDGEGEARVTWVSRAREEVSIDLDSLRTRSTVLMEPWVGTFKSEVNNLLGRYLDSEHHLLNLLSDRINLRFGKLIVHGDFR